ncbi:MAG: arginase [Flavobacteriales bacterium]|nr:arginase [Flavobacteriales bacterium]
MTKIEIINNPSELGAGTRGSSLGFDALKVAGWNKENDLLNRYDTHTVEVNNAALYEADPTPHAHRIAGITDVFRQTGELLKAIEERGNFPVIIGADHSVAAGTISGLKMIHPDQRIGVIWIDAHADLHTPYTTPSGNVHGMPLAIVLGEDNLEERKNDPKEATMNEWSEIKNLWGISPKFRHEDLVFFGVRDTEAEEDALIARKGIRNFTVDEVRSRSISEAVNDACMRLGNCDLVYVSFDVDSMDPEIVSHGTGTPVDNGFTPQESAMLIKLLIERLPVVCFEMVEINPTLDEKKNKMAEVSFEILEQTIEFIQQKISG